MLGVIHAPSLNVRFAMVTARRKSESCSKVRAPYGSQFADEEAVRRLVQRLALSAGRRLDVRASASGRRAAGGLANAAAGQPMRLTECAAPGHGP
ncbi:hypothetical protein Atai01_10140 [Amycolatopsis taiwanensis]|uniref:Uncharacterized protein n=1 Tax=Amycolatopsis taiwanensis TaxID=342230 RepID=A0A9W6QWV5_9PSEU|nr:hypothetical protein Atai01_10140 [Amycolatopsis taiwanensis]